MAPSCLLISSAGLVIMELLIPPEIDYCCLSLELPTPACLELMIDADYCTRQLRGLWELRLYTAEAERVAGYLDGASRSA
ncbi:hypothetical protein GCM10011352_14550 [Marinobacterium zhoushanense]|uniref:Uncharacterized protein n=1 Tax=Marinobacterium zhoushanense TaxID=1679163 RepID=A0ABQ1KC92_9GAMM|nr:hypothetical protein [Marinobacterium zhoushanense]GGB89632.1 hypothetical protein GCM10011352_14550 [Marinobacterium zhoushanense]